MDKDLLPYIAVVLAVFIIIGILHLILGPQNPVCADVSYFHC